MSKEFLEYQESKNRRDEARRLISVIDVESLNLKEQRIVMSWISRLQKSDPEVNKATIFLLRDIKDRQLEI